MIKTSVDDRVGTLVFDRPDKLNALGAELLAGSVEVFKKCSRDPDVGAVVVTGSGRAFCAGGEVSSMGKDTSEAVEQGIDPVAERHEGLRGAFTSAHEHR